MPKAEYATVLRFPANIASEGSSVRTAVPGFILGRRRAAGESLRDGQPLLGVLASGPQIQIGARTALGNQVAEVER